MSAIADPSDYPSFRRRIRCCRDGYLREVLNRHQDVIRVKKEEVALPKLEVIFEKTLEISNQHGFQAMSVRDLGEATGISMGSLYSYIESKDRLLDMILTYGHVMVNHALRIPDGVEGARRRMHYVLRTHVYLSEVMQPWFYFSYMESRHFKRDSRAQTMAGELRTETLIHELLEEGVAEGVYHVSDTEFTAALIKPLLQDWYLKRWKYRRRKVSVDDYADGMIAFIESAVGHPAAATAQQSRGVMK